MLRGMTDKLTVLYGKHRELIAYLVVGGLTTLVSLSVYYGCVLTFLDPQSAVQLQAANVLSWVASVTFAYFANRRFVFHSRNRSILREAALFYAGRVGTLLLDMAVMFLGVTVLGQNDKLVKLADQVIVIAANYVISKLFVFKKGQK